MNTWLAGHRTAAVGGVLIFALMGLLMVLAWGIIESNIVASMLSGAGLAVIIVLGGSILLVPDNTRPQATERMLLVASNTLEHLRGGLTAENCAAVCTLLLPETTAQGIAFTDTERVLAYEGTLHISCGPGSENTWPTREVLSSKRVETFVSLDSDDQQYRSFVPGMDEETRAAGIIVPLLVQDNAVGTIKLYYRSAASIDRTQMAIARGFGGLISSQLSSHELDTQAELTAKAELRALQAQINPHFLFNALNTMAALARTDPMRSRELLREFAVFYRRTLESSDQNITLAAELDQTRRYLTIEQARFGEGRIVETEHIAPGCESVLVPPFIVQPIVENAVRHAMRDEGPLHIDIYATKQGNDILIAVADDGLGMDQELVDRLLSGNYESPQGTANTGIAVHNVEERLKRVYGGDSGIEIVSRPDEGTVVTLRLADVAQPRDNEATMDVEGLVSTLGTME